MAVLLLSCLHGFGRSGLAVKYGKAAGTPPEALVREEDLVAAPAQHGLAPQEAHREERQQVEPKLPGTQDAVRRGLDLGLDGPSVDRRPQPPHPAAVEFHFREVA